MLLYDAAVMGVLAVLTVALFGVMGLLHASVIVVSLSLPLSVFFFLMMIIAYSVLLDTFG